RPRFLTATMPLQGAGQSPQESFLVMYLETASPSSLMLLLASGKSRAATPRQFLIGASPFSTLSAVAPVVPRSAHSCRIACCGAYTLMPKRDIRRYRKASIGLGFANQTMSRVFQERSALYCWVTPWHSSRKRPGFATGTSPEPCTTIAFRFFEP